ncbi:MAG: family 10 glycosylhydrolase [Armatimonadota bacterium]|jgi:uncharacterized lipoprotein YddW (UPF0748 family)
MGLRSDAGSPGIMRRRRALWLGLGACTAVLGAVVILAGQPTSHAVVRPEAPAATASSRSGELRGVWMGPEGVPTWEETMRSLRTHGFNAAFPWMCSAGAAYYRSSVLPVSPKVATEGDALAECVAAGRRWGIEVHARMVALMTYTGTPQVREAFRAAGRTVVGSGGEAGSNWLCPSQPRNREMVVAAAVELATEYDVDGVQLDYIRYPSSGSCFCGTCRTAFEQSLGRPAPDWPTAVATGELRVPFLEWRCEQITSLVRELSDKVRAARPGVYVSASVFYDWERHRFRYGQDWKRWVEEGLVGFVCPMDYTRSTSVFAQRVRSQVRWVDGAAPLYVGIGPYSDGAKLTPEQVEEQIAISRRLGADGFVLFNYCEGLASSHLPRLSRTIAALPPATPPHAVPELAFGLPDGVEIGGERFHEAGGELLGIVCLSGALADDGRPRRVRIAAHRTSGEPIGELGSANVPPGGSASFGFAAPPGDLRIAAIFEREASGHRPTIKWSPLLRVRTAEQIERLRSRYRPPAPGEQRPTVAVFAGGRGSGPTLDALRTDDGIYSFLLTRLEPPTGAADALVLPQLRAGPEALPRATAAALSAWVENGGGILVTHDAAGYRGYPAIAPPVCLGGTGVSRSTRCTVATPGPLAPVWGKGAGIIHAHSDHILLRAGSQGTKIVADGTDPGGAPVVVAGEFGKGRLVASGIAYGLDKDGADGPLTTDERVLLLGAVRWLGHMGSTLTK